MSPERLDHLLILVGPYITKSRVGAVQQSCQKNDLLSRYAI